MKWLYLSVIIILYITIVRTSSSHEKHEDEHDKCYEEYQKQTELALNCAATNFDGETFGNELNVTLTNSGDDDSGIREFAAKYCPKVENFISCFPVRYEVSDNCQRMLTPFKYNETVLLKEVLLSVINYICENNAEVVSQIYKHDGLDTIIENEQFMECQQVMYRYKMVKRGAVEFEINPEFCSAQEDVLKCYVETVQTHKNKNLIGIANAIWAKAKDVLKC